MCAIMVERVNVTTDLKDEGEPNIDLDSGSVDRHLLEVTKNRNRCVQR